MPKAKLQHPPLVEAILEIRWKLAEQSPGVSIDPNYKLLVGRLYDKVLEIYPHHEPLPSSNMPDELSGYMVQHRFRSKKDDWPLIQIGPGIVTLNDTNKYVWQDFRDRGCQLIEQLFATYPNAANDLSIINLQLKYIDAIDFNFGDKDILEFITDNLGINMKFPEKFFIGAPIVKRPSGLNALFSFPLENPVGTLNLHFGTGLNNNKKTVLWETIVQSDNEEIVKMPDKFRDWFEASHTFTHNMFFKLIEGHLEEVFQ
jgi:uncharacterized protein (TIGR04255 family)